MERKGEGVRVGREIGRRSVSGEREKERERGE